MSEVRRTWDVLIDADVSFEPIDAEGAAEDLEDLRVKWPEAFAAMSTGVFVARLERLHQAVLRDEAAMTRLAANATFHSLCGEELFEVIEGPTSTEILATVIRDLAPGDRAYFESMIAEQAFSEATEAFLEAVPARALSLEPEHVRVAPPRGAQDLAARRCRMVMVVETKVEPIDRSLAETHLAELQEYGSFPDIRLPEFVARQRSLLAGLERNEAALDAFLRHQALIEAALCSQAIWSRARTEDILAPVIAGMAPEDRAMFDELAARNLLHGATLSLDLSVEAQLVAAEVVPGTRVSPASTP